MAGKNKFVSWETEQGKLYGQPIFSGQRPRSRVMKDVIEEIEEEINTWEMDKEGIMLDCRGVFQHQTEYYLTAAEKNWGQRITSDEAGDLEIEQVYSWFLQLVEALLEVKTGEKSWPLIKLDHLRRDEENKLKLLPPKTADYLLLYSQDQRPQLPRECYRPPELFQADDGEREVKNDKIMVFNLAVIFYYLLTGEAPYSGRDKSEILERVKKGRKIPAHIVRPEIGRKFSELLDRCLQPENHKRPGLKELKTELRDLSAEELVRPKRDINIKKIDRRRRIFRWKQTLYYQVRRKWPALAILAVLIIGIPLIFLTGGPERYITPGHAPEEVAEYFYQAINDKDVTMLDDTSNIDMGELRRMVTETHVMETVQQLYQTEDVEVEDEEITREEMGERLETLFGVEELEIELSEEDPPRVETEYIFFFQREEEVIRWPGGDEIIFQKIDDRWQIVRISGFMERVMRGELHELDESEQLQ